MHTYYKKIETNIQVAFIRRIMNQSIKKIGAIFLYEVSIGTTIVIEIGGNSVTLPRH